MVEKVAIHWFRQDLRLSDNPALALAAKQNKVLPLYILNEENAGKYSMGAASRWWLHYSLVALNKSLNGKLALYRDHPIDVFRGLLDNFNISGVFWNRCYEPWRIAQDKKIRELLKQHNIISKEFNGCLLWEPSNIKKADGEHYKVFTPFYKKGCLNSDTPRKPIPSPKNIKWVSDKKSITDIEELNLLPKFRWDNKLKKYWNIGEIAAKSSLEKFINHGLDQYKEGRNLPSKPYTSRLSPHLHFGEISPAQVWHSICDKGDNKNTEHFCSELGWREFSFNQLYHNPDLPTNNLQKKFDRFPWLSDDKLLDAWKKGIVGIPMVDAGMRELWETGYMHNRVRMIVGSFLVKNLRLHWHHGERWFWDTLVDADLANNSASWQWIAGCGADAAPYFRIFNPVTQGKRFDPEGYYIRRFIPELSALPNKYLFNPWEAPSHILDNASVILGKTYPLPIVDLKLSRVLALEAFQSLKEMK